jgi:hypothetical protein
MTYAMCGECLGDLERKPTSISRLAAGHVCAGRLVEAHDQAADGVESDLQLSTELKSTYDVGTMSNGQAGGPGT